MKEIKELELLNEAAQEYREKRLLYKAAEQDVNRKKQQVEDLLNRLRDELFGE